MLNQVDAIVSRAIAKVQSGGSSLLYDPDPVVFARRLGYEPDEWQAEFLRSTDKNVLLNCSRQSGKSTTSAVKAYHTGIGTPNSLILLLSPSLRQSGELFRKVLDFHGEADNATDEQTKLTMTLSNGSRIVSLPGTEKTIRGYSGANLIIIDEASRVPDELYYSIRPMLAVSGGNLMMLSTPFGRRGFWFEAWQNGGDTWRRFRIPAPLCPRIPADFLEQERRTMGQWWFDQEYMTEFMDSATAAFSYDDVQAALHGERVESWKL
jgi:hypothetical protein